MNKAMLIGLFFFYPLFSAAQTLEGTCGDHWFNVDFEVDTVSCAGTMTFSGDSGIWGTYPATYRKNSLSGFNIQLRSANGYLRLESVNATKGIYDGYFSHDGSMTSEQNLGSCYIKQK